MTPPIKSLSPFAVIQLPNGAVDVSIARTGIVWLRVENNGGARAGIGLSPVVAASLAATLESAACIGRARQYETVRVARIQKGRRG